MPDDCIDVLFASPEVSPFASTGGLAEVAGSLPRALSGAGLPTSVIMPAYADALPKGSFQETITGLSVDLGAESVPFSILEGRLSEDVPIYLVRCDRYFDRPGLYGHGRMTWPDNPERYAFFSKAVVASLTRLPTRPEVVLANDWQTGLMMPLLLESGPKSPKGLFLIHNQGYLGLAPAEIGELIGLPEPYYGVEGIEYYGQLSFLKAGIVYGQAVVTVSPSYAKEIQTPEGGNGLDGVLRLYAAKLHGIVNGVDYERWNPATDPDIAQGYSASDPEGKKECKRALLEELGLPQSGRPLFGMVSRLTAQKGFALLVESAAEMFRLGLDLVILGSGEPWFEERLTELAARYPDNMRLILGYDVAMSHRLIAASDFVLVPSMYEPCGLIQLYGLRYGAIPVVRAIGGLNDTVRDFAGQNPDGLWDNGFKFNQFQPGALVRACRRACELYARPTEWAKMSLNNLREDYSWASSAQSYAKLIRSLARPGPGPGLGRY
jgi:starch synthase